MLFEFIGAKYWKGAKRVNAVFKEEHQKRSKKHVRPAVTYISDEDDDFEPPSAKRPALSTKSSSEAHSSVTIPKSDPKITSRIFSLEYRMVKVESELFKQQSEFDKEKTHF